MWQKPSLQCSPLKGQRMKCRKGVSLVFINMSGGGALAFPPRASHFLSAREGRRSPCRPGLQSAGLTAPCTARTPTAEQIKDASLFQKRSISHSEWEGRGFFWTTSPLQHHPTASLESSPCHLPELPTPGNTTDGLGMSKARVRHGLRAGRVSRFSAAACTACSTAPGP